MERVIQILLVENDRIDQNNVRRELNRRKILHKLIIATSGEDALRWMYDSVMQVVSKPDIILLAEHIVEMDGIEFLSHLRGHTEWKDCNVFVLSESDDPMARTKVVDYSVSGYIIKPLRLEYPSSSDTIHLMVDLANMQQHSVEA